jgi:hypothetical protein
MTSVLLQLQAELERMEAEREPMPAWPEVAVPHRKFTVSNLEQLEERALVNTLAAARTSDDLSRMQSEYGEAQLRTDSAEALCAGAAMARHLREAASTAAAGGVPNEVPAQARSPSGTPAGTGEVGVLLELRSARLAAEGRAEAAEGRNARLVAEREEAAARAQLLEARVRALEEEVQTQRVQIQAARLGDESKAAAAAAAARRERDDARRQFRTAQARVGALQVEVRALEARAQAATRLEQESAALRHAAKAAEARCATRRERPPLLPRLVLPWPWQRWQLRAFLSIGFR